MERFPLGTAGLSARPGDCGRDCRVVHQDSFGPCADGSSPITRCCRSASAGTSPAGDRTADPTGQGMRSSTRSSRCTTSRRCSGASSRLDRPSSGGSSSGVVADQAASHRRAVRADQLDRVAGAEVALRRRSPRRTAARSGGAPRPRPRRRRAPAGRAGWWRTAARTAATWCAARWAGTPCRPARRPAPARPPRRPPAAPARRRRRRSGRRRACSPSRRCRSRTRPSGRTGPGRGRPRRSTSGSSRAPGRRGSPSYRPSTSDSRTSASARTRWATSAASRSLSPNRISSVATASFSFTTGTTPSCSSRSSVRCGVAVVRAADQVVRGEQHLPDGEAGPGEGRRVPLDQQHLPDAGRGLLGGEVARAGRQAERGEPGGDGAGGDQHQLGAGGPAGGERVDQPVEPAGIQAAGRGGQRRRADLDHEPRRVPHGVPGGHRRPPRPGRRCRGAGGSAASPASLLVRIAGVPAAVPGQPLGGGGPGAGLHPDVGAARTRHRTGQHARRRAQGRLPVEGDRRRSSPPTPAPHRPRPARPRRRAGPAGRRGSRPPRRCGSRSAAPTAPASCRAPRTRPRRPGHARR